MNLCHVCQEGIPFSVRDTIVTTVKRFLKSFGLKLTFKYYSNT